MPRTIDGNRLWASLMAMAEIGATERGGVDRQALTAVDGRGRDRFVSWCRDAGLVVRVDQVGNIFARRPGVASDAPVVLAGSHLDTQPTGGRFDGCYGVMAALEAVRTMNDLGIETNAAVEVVVWSNEEGCRFVPAMSGSGAFAGVYTPSHVLAQTDRTGVRFGDALEAIGYAGTESVGDRLVDSYFEAHIEQGPVLEDAGIPIGVVTGALGVRWYDVEIDGQEAHAGPTPMHLRRDSLVAASELVVAIDRIGRGDAWSRGTCGSLGLRPNSRNVVPGHVDLTIDLRHLDALELDRLETAARAAIAAIADDRSVSVAMDRVFDFPPMRFDEACVGAVRDAAVARGVETMDLPSGAGHDAVYLARVAPTAMVFVPCRDGLSHNEAEFATPADLALGGEILLDSMLERAGVERGPSS